MQHLTFPDAGFYWYHPHIREDYGLELGLYGTVLVEPSDPEYWAPADRYLTLTLDDLLVEDGTIAPFRRSGPTYTAMGRFGNIMLVNGETEFTGGAAVGEVVRLYVVNTANTRVFRFGISGAAHQARGQRQWAIRARAVRRRRAPRSVRARGPRRAVRVARRQRLEHRTPDRVYELGRFSVSDSASGSVTSAASQEFEVLRTDPELSARRDEIAADFDRPPDKTLTFWAEMPILYGDDGSKETSEIPGS